MSVHTNDDFAANSPSVRAGYVSAEALTEIESLKELNEKNRTMGSVEAGFATLFLIGAVMVAAVAAPIVTVALVAGGGYLAHLSNESFSVVKKTNQEIAKKVKAAGPKSGM